MNPVVLLSSFFGILRSFRFLAFIVFVCNVNIYQCLYRGFTTPKSIYISGLDGRKLCDKFQQQLRLNERQEIHGERTNRKLSLSLLPATQTENIGLALYDLQLYFSNFVNSIDA